MSENFEKNLISAYYDGELAPEERAQAEELLESSLDARQELDDYARISEALRPLAERRAPDEFSAAVMAQAERETLLPAGSTSSAGGWLIPIAGLLATAAALFLVLQAFQPGTEEPSRIAEHRSPTNPEGGENGAESADVAFNENADTRDFKTLEKRAGRSAEDRTARMKGSRLRSAPGEATAGAKPPAAPPAEDAAESPGFETDDAEVIPRGRGVPDRQRLRDHVANRLNRSIEIGEVIPYLASNEGNVAVVELTVVDVRQALGAMQVVLDKSRIPAQPAPESEGEPHNDKAAPKDDGLYVVYVEATAEQVKAALGELGNSDVFVDLKLQPPVPVAVADARQDMAERLRKLAAEGDADDAAKLSETQNRAVETAKRFIARNAPEKPAAGAAKPHDAKTQSAAPTKKKASEEAQADRSEKRPDRSLARDAVEKENKGRLAKAFQSYRVTLQLNEDEVGGRQTGQKAPGSITRRAVQEPALPASKNAEAAESLTEELELKQAAAVPMRLLFVLRSQMDVE